jgi:hypothetical protein
LQADTLNGLLPPNVLTVEDPEEIPVRLEPADTETDSAPAYNVHYQDPRYKPPRIVTLGPRVGAISVIGVKKPDQAQFSRGNFKAFASRVEGGSSAIEYLHERAAGS